jgi:hypothetical protein
MRRSTALSLPLQLVFPGLTPEQGNQVTLIEELTNTNKQHWQPIHLASKIGMFPVPTM